MQVLYHLRCLLYYVSTVLRGKVLRELYDAFGHQQVVRATETQVLVGFMGDDLPVAAELVSELWDAGLKADYLVNKRVMKHIDYAKESRIPWMVLVGDRELSEGVVKLKDIESSKEEVVPRSKIVQELLNRL